MSKLYLINQDIKGVYEPMLEKYNDITTKIQILFLQKRNFINKKDCFSFNKL